ncbi:MAG: transposase [Thermomicrobiales bacterium]
MDTRFPAAPVASDTDDPTIWRVDDAFWATLEPVLRVGKPRTKPGRPRRDDRAIFDGLIRPARTGSRRAALPRAFGPESTVHLRFTEWIGSGASERAWAAAPAAHDSESGPDRTWVAADGCIVKAPCGKRGGPANRGRRGAAPPTAANPAPNATS